jgi:hypothetical protein
MQDSRIFERWKSNCVHSRCLEKATGTIRTATRRNSGQEQKVDIK